MAMTEAGAELTEAHGVAQLGIIGRLLRLFEAEWSVGVAFDSVAFVAWVNDMAPEVAAAYALSAQAAERYYAAFRAAENVPGPLVRASVPPPDPSRFVESLDRFGPAYARSLLEKGVTDDEAVRRALVQMSLSATRDAAAGGRDSIAAHLDADEAALGWQRVPRANCCAFCAMLASRGPVYSSRRAAGGGRHWHRGCKCRPEPVFDRRTALPAEAARYAELWDRVDPTDLNEFRRALERPHLHRTDEPSDA